MKPTLSQSRIGEYPLFCIAAERWHLVNGKGKWLPDGFTYCHAASAQAARVAFCQDNVGKKFRIVAVGPVVGFKAHDDNADVISV